MQRFFYGRRDDGIGRRIDHHLLMATHKAMGRAASPSAGVTDSQWVELREAGAPRGYQAGKKIKGRKRHILTYSDWPPVAARVHAADVQDREGAVPLLAFLRKSLPWPPHVLHHGGYAGDGLDVALTVDGPWTLAIAKRSDGAEVRELRPRR